MKVDKGVCTSNDAYFADNTTTTTTTNELSSIIKFETVFTTLVENKILAIKRECEEHENKKKARTLKGILLRKSNDVVRGATIDEDKSKEAAAEEDGEVLGDKKKRKNFFSKYYKKPKTFADVENDVERGKDDSDELVNVVVVKNDEQGGNRRRRRSRSDAKLDSQSNELDVANLLNSSAKLNAAECDKQNCDKLIIDRQENNNAQVPLSTNNHSNVSKQPINYENDESLATTIDISLQQQSSAVHAASSKVLAIVPINNTNNNSNNHKNSNKSDLAICDDGVSSQNTSDIEFSLPSENSMSEIPRSGAKVKSSVAKSDPVIKKCVSVVSSSTRDKKACERKAISCQSTPIFLRHKHVRSESEGKKVLTFQKELPKSSSSNNEHSYGKIDTIKSQTIVIAPTSTKTTTTLAKPTTTTTVTAVSGHLPPLEAVHVVSNAGGSKKGQKHSTKLRDVSLEYKITYDDGDENQSPHGFISSFNQLQLTSQKQSAAIISANIKKQTSKDQHKKVELVDQDDLAKQDIELDELDVEAVNKKKKHKRKSKLKSFSRKLADEKFNFRAQ